MADAGVSATTHLMKQLQQAVKSQGITEARQVQALLEDLLCALLLPLEKPLILGQAHPSVIMVTGVNGAGKTTSIGKLTRHLSQSGASVLLAAADTFRAAAREQLEVWADRSRVDIVSQAGGDPAAVAFDAVSAGKARGKDVVIVDTAGRLPTQTHLMEELKKIKRVVQKADPTAPHEVLLVIDGNTGQNALAQVQAFDQALGLTGLIVTKLDGAPAHHRCCRTGLLHWRGRKPGRPANLLGAGVLSSCAGQCCHGHARCWLKPAAVQPGLRARRLRQINTG
jgi:fused signal recognition particle receptor